MIAIDESNLLISGGYADGIAVYDCYMFDTEKGEVRKTNTQLPTGNERCFYNNPVVLDSRSNSVYAVSWQFRKEPQALKYEVSEEKWQQISMNEVKKE